MAACELARISPSEDLIEPLLHFVAEPVEGYQNVPGAGGSPRPSRRARSRSSS
jgi:hypothetical protein